MKLDQWGFSSLKNRDKNFKKTVQILEVCETMSRHVCNWGGIRRRGKWVIDRYFKK